MLWAPTLPDVQKIGRVGGGDGGGGFPFPTPNPIGKAGGGIPGPPVPPLVDRLPGLQSLGQELSRIAQPPSPQQLVGAVPGLDQAPGVGGFTNLIGDILGFGRSNPSWNDLFGDGGIIRSQMRGGSGYTNPYENLLGKYAGAAGRDPYYG